MSSSVEHTPPLAAEEREYWAAASLTTKGRRVDVCADTGECVDICDTLSQQMYVISFRRVERVGGSERERKKKKERANERKLQDLAESGARGLL